MRRGRRELYCEGITHHYILTDRRVALPQELLSFIYIYINMIIYVFMYVDIESSIHGGRSIFYPKTTWLARRNLWSRLPILASRRTFLTQTTEQPTITLGCQTMLRKALNSYGTMALPFGGGRLPLTSVVHVASNERTARRTFRRYTLPISLGVSVLDQQICPTKLDMCRSNLAPCCSSVAGDWNTMEHLVAVPPAAL